MTQPAVASGEPPDPLVSGGGVLAGRDAELAQLFALVGRARSGSAGALVVTGEAGAGKTALLDVVARSAADVQVLQTRGIASEEALAHGALLQLLAPLRHRVAGIPTRQRQAIEAALGWGDAEGDADRFLVAAGAMSLLAAAADVAPVLVLVDDFQWVDPQSREAILFSARRLAHDAVAVVMAVREDLEMPDTGGMEHLHVGGLGLEAIEVMLGSRASPAVAAALHRATGGIPLALVEVITTLSAAQRRGAASLPEPLMSTGRADRLFAPVVADLTGDLRTAAVVLAASGDCRPAPVLAACRQLGVDADAALVDLELRRVVVVGPGVVDFRHPLLRSAVWERATAPERRTAHAALADVLTDDDPDVGLRHGAQAATAPDESLAAQLERVAAEDRRRHGHAAASSTLELAARLSPDRRHQMLRLAAATQDAALAGDVTRARHLASDVLAAPNNDDSTGLALAALGIAEQCSGSIPAAERLLTDAAVRSEGRAAIYVLAELFMVRHQLGDLAGMRQAAGDIASVADRADPPQRFAADHFAGLAAACSGRVEEGRLLLGTSLSQLQADSNLRADPRWLVPAVFAAAWVELRPELVAFLESLLDNARRRGSFGRLVPTLAMFSYGRAWLGDHDGAYADAAEAVDLAAELGFVADAAPAMEMLAWQLACRGDHDDACAALARAAELVERAGTATVAAHLALAQAHAALCRDDLNQVVTILEPRLRIDDLAGSLGEQLGAAPMLVEALVALGRRSDAAALSTRLQAIEGADGRTQALVARCRGLVTLADDEAVAAFRTAIASHTAANDAPYELARTELLLGARLRRAGRRAEARDTLRCARDRFASMGLALWSQRCTRELAASGETRRHGRAGADEPLTPQEARVLQLVVRGMTNAEVAAAMFLSPKTVEHHLSSIYRKRDVRSRTQLCHLILGDVDPPTER